MSTLPTVLGEPLARVPSALRAVAQQLLSSWWAGVPSDLARWIEPAPIATAVVKVFTVSRFVAMACTQQPQLLPGLLRDGELLSRAAPEHYPVALRAALRDVTDESDVMRRLRRLRQREMVRIAFRDIAGFAELEETLADTSRLAEACVAAAAMWLHQQATRERAAPQRGSGGAQQLVVLAMGKLGGGELNFSSDIDLIFAYPEDGALPGPRAITYHEFFTRIAQRLVKLLDAVTEDGLVFRIDTRLRPFGEAGPLVMSFEALEQYYQSQAREWERYAMVKARPITGVAEDAAELMAILQPFVYRRYLDYRAFGELRELKLKITTQLQRRDRPNDIKLGRGGIREIEFIAQAFQLIRGGREPALRDRRLLPTLNALGALGLVPESIMLRLIHAYRFFRLVENRLQQYDDHQTHALPTAALEWTRLALALDAADVAALRAQVDRWRNAVHEVFEQVVETPPADGEAERLIFWPPGELPVRSDALATLGFAEPNAAAAQLAAFRRAPAIRRLSAKGAMELAKLMPPLLRAVAAGREPGAALPRLLHLLEQIASRHVYFTLLNEHPLALSQLVKLTALSPFIARTLARQPLLLDDLIDPRALYAPLSKPHLEQALAHSLAACESGDLEQALNELRRFKQSHVLKVAAADLMGAIPLTTVSDYLTWLAEVLLAAVLQLAYTAILARHSPPTGATEVCASGFAVIGYGKFGGLELGYGSDLDLVFLFAEPPAGTAGPTARAQFYARLTRKMIHFFTAPLLSGALYPLDLRLRPSGASGLLVSSLDAYARYQREDAWTWEHQALVRARYLAGDPQVGAEFTQIRDAILARPREYATLRREVTDMREKMRATLEVRDSDCFDLKQGVGGIIDIEFIVQFGVLAYAQQYPELRVYSDILRNLDQLPHTGLLNASEAAALRDAYCRFRARVHRLALMEQRAVVTAGEFTAPRQWVWDIWKRIFAG